MTRHAPPRRRSTAMVLGLAGTLAAGLIAATSATAAFPGSNGTIAHVQNVDGNLDVYTINPDGTGETRLTSDPLIDTSPDYSPDGTKIVFVRQVVGVAGTVYTMDADGSNQAAILTTAGLANAGGVGDASWAPDGNRIVFATSIPNSQLRIVNADGTGLSAPFGPVGALRPEWSPDGSTIVFQSDHEGDTEIYSIVPDGTGLTRLTNAAGLDLSPDWSPDGARIIWERPDSAEVRIMDADGSNQANLGPFGIHPAFSPDGTRYVTAAVQIRSAADGSSIGSFSRSTARQFDWQPIPQDDLEPLTATKTAVPSYTKLHRWEVGKTPNRQVFYNHDKNHVAVDYTVRVAKRNGGVRDVEVTGSIAVTNPNDEAVDLGPITDALPGATCSVAISPSSIGANATINVPYTCTFPNQVPGGALTNTATVNYGDGETTEATAPVDFSQAEVNVKNGAVKVIDRLGDGPSKVLADGLTSSKVFTYRRYLKAPAKPSCIYHPNTAKVIGLMPNGEIEREAGSRMRILAEATAKVRVCQKAPTPPSSEDPKPPSGSEDPPRVIITPGSSEDPRKPRPRPAVVKPSSEDPKPAVNRKAKLRVTKRARVKYTRVGKKMVFTIMVRNTGRTAARGVVITDRLPRHLRALKTSMSRKSSVKRRLVRVKLGTIRPGAHKRVRVVAYASSRPTLNGAIKKKIALAKNRKAKAKLRYRARKGIVCNVAFAGARNAARSNLGVACVRVQPKPRPEPTEPDPG